VVEEKELALAGIVEMILDTREQLQHHTLRVLYTKWPLRMGPNWRQRISI